jgi:hypothetical protein
MVQAGEGHPHIRGDGLSRRRGTESDDFAGRRSDVYEENDCNAGRAGDSCGPFLGGAVITQAGGDPKVVGLVYVAAYAPEAGQSANDASSPFGWTEGQKQIRVNSEKFATITSEDMLEDIAEGLPMAERKLALAVQGQAYGPMFDEKLTWKSKPTWAIVSAKDRMLPVRMEEAAAKRMGAVITTLPTCHMVILQEPAAVAAVIDEAAKKSLKTANISNRILQQVRGSSGRQASRRLKNVSFTMNVHQKEPNSHEYEELCEDPVLCGRRSTRPDRPPVRNHAASP